MSQHSRAGAPYESWSSQFCTSSSFPSFRCCWLSRLFWDVHPQKHTFPSNKSSQTAVCRKGAATHTAVRQVPDLSLSPVTPNDQHKKGPGFGMPINQIITQNSKVSHKIRQYNSLIVLNMNFYRHLPHDFLTCLPKKSWPLEVPLHLCHRAPIDHPRAERWKPPVEPKCDDVSPTKSGISQNMNWHNLMFTIGNYVPTFHNIKNMSSSTDGAKEDFTYEVWAG